MSLSGQFFTYKNTNETKTNQQKYNQVNKKQQRQQFFAQKNF